MHCFRDAATGHCLIDTDRSFFTVYSWNGLWIQNTEGACWHAPERELPSCMNWVTHVHVSSLSAWLMVMIKVRELWSIRVDKYPSFEDCLAGDNLADGEVKWDVRGQGSMLRMKQEKKEQVPQYEGMVRLTCRDWGLMAEVCDHVWSSHFNVVLYVERVVWETEFGWLGHNHTVCL